MTDAALVNISTDDLPAVLALNNLYAVELSWLDQARLECLVGRAYYARTTADRTAFLIAFDANADYDSANYQWFRARMTAFVYVDRVAVAPVARGQGLARRLYADLFHRASQDGVGLICCEVNADPPNKASDAFHRSLGFRPIGRAAISSGKIVAYLVRELVFAPPAPTLC